MKAIIIAAGQGRRLRPYTDDRAKCMVEVGGRTLLQRQVDALRAAGVHDILVIRGYKAGSVQAAGVRYVTNHGYAHNNILESLFSAGEELVGELVVSYGDIFYQPKVVQALVRCHHPATLVLDQGWRAMYEGRTDHPIEQAELAEVSNLGLITRVGKEVGPERAFGEFIGLCRFGAPMTARLYARYLQARQRGLDAPYGNAPSLRQAYLTDLFNDAIGHGESFGVLAHQGDFWREIDTVQDLERARASVKW
jgi:choline kinase